MLANVEVDFWVELESTLTIKIWVLTLIACIVECSDLRSIFVNLKVKVEVSWVGIEMGVEIHQLVLITTKA